MRLEDIKPGQGEEIPEDNQRISPRSQARRVALQALYQWQLNNSDMCDIVKQFTEDKRLLNLDIELFNDLVNSISSQYKKLDDLYSAFLDRNVALINPVEKTILRIGVYELQSSLSVPYKSVIDEAVELAKSFGAEGGHKYINGILDKVAKNLRELEINN
jgi:N utilization substance protein B